MKINYVTRFPSWALAFNWRWLCCALASLTLGASAQEQMQPSTLQVIKQQVIPLPAEGRKLIFQRVNPPPLPPPPEIKSRPPVDPVRAAERLAYWRSIAPLETRLLSLNAIIYDNGLSFLSWGQLGDNGIWEQYEAWSGTDFSSLWLAPDFDIGRTRYYLFASVMQASAKFSGRRPLPGPLVFDQKSSGFVLVKGDPNNQKALAGITALHEIYKKEGPQITGDWVAFQERTAADLAWAKANPPAPKDTIIQFWPSLSRRHATATSSSAPAQAR